MPTMWRSERTLPLLTQYNECPHVKEILLINNNSKDTLDTSHLQKVVTASFGGNMFVNPSWNIGVSMSSSEHVVISNDDITFDVNKALEFMSEQEFDCVGVHPVGINSDDEHQMEILDGTFIGHGWGILMFMKKQRYKKIPSSLKIWFGDNWLQMTCPTAGSLVLNVETEMSVTSGSKEFNEVIMRDIKNWTRLNDLHGDVMGMASNLY